MEDQKRRSLSFVSSLGLEDSSSNASVSEAEDSNCQQLNIEPSKHEKSLSDAINVDLLKEEDDMNSLMAQKAQPAKPKVYNEFSETLE